MRVLDERFLTVHPRTALWWEQRKQCERCVNLIRHVSGASVRDPATMLKCRVVPGCVGPETCIGARDEGRACGPDGRLFEEAK